MKIGDPSGAGVLIQLKRLQVLFLSFKSLTQERLYLLIKPATGVWSKVMLATQLG